MTNSKYDYRQADSVTQHLGGVPKNYQAGGEQVAPRPNSMVFQDDFHHRLCSTFQIHGGLHTPYCASGWTLWFLTALPMTWCPSAFQMWHHHWGGL